jgi:hypothetical protein
MTPTLPANPTPRRLALLLAVPAAVALLAPANAAAQAAPFPIADIYFEFNATARDIGAHVSLDAPNWKEVRIVDPTGKRLVELEPQGNFRRVGITEVFFEGAEPSLADVPFSEFLTRVPAGEYLFLGTTVDNGRLRSSDPLTTEIPCPVEIVSPGAQGKVDADDVVVRWRPAPGIFDPDGDVCNSGEVDLVAYEVLVVLENEAFPFKRQLALHLPAGATSIAIPPDFIRQGARLPGTIYEIEVSAIEDTGNRTFAAREFKVERE